MGVPTSDVGYTSATTRRGDYEVHKGHVMALGGEKLKKNKKNIKTVSPTFSSGLFRDSLLLALQVWPDFHLLSHRASTERVMGRLILQFCKFQLRYGI
jgi:hypothetical protein